MSLDLLLKKYQKIYANLKEASGLVRNTENQLKGLEKSISDKVTEDLERFLMNFNKNLLRRNRVTKLHVHYNGVLKRAFVTITSLDGETYVGDGRLPSYLEGLREFGKAYPVEVYFRTLDHPPGDPLEEWK